MLSPDKITKAEFDELLNNYPALIDEITQSKGAKDGQKTLQELDQYRYVDAVKTFGADAPHQDMKLDDVKALVEWKLRHGKFRPTLMSLVSSNPPAFTESTIQTAIKAYRTKSSPSSKSKSNSKSNPRDNAAVALEALTKLKGIGPATASLLLSVHDPAGVIFFSDEAFYWLCSEGAKTTIKYNPKEYQALRSEAGRLAERLGVSATDIEKAAYVVMKQQHFDGPKAEKTKLAAPKPDKKSKSPSTSIPPKRKTASNDTKTTASQTNSKQPVESETPVRRSKRIRS